MRRAVGHRAVIATARLAVGAAIASADRLVDACVLCRGNSAILVRGGGRVVVLMVARHLSGHLAHRLRAIVSGQQGGTGKHALQWRNCNKQRQQPV